MIEALRSLSGAGASHMTYEYNCKRHMSRFARVSFLVPGSPLKLEPPLKFEVIDCVRGVVSPALSNILLTPFDREMRLRGHQLTRYADDCAPRRRGEECVI